MDFWRIEGGGRVAGVGPRRRDPRVDGVRHVVLAPIVTTVASGGSGRSHASLAGLSTHGPLAAGTAPSSSRGRARPQAAAGGGGGRRAAPLLSSGRAWPAASGRGPGGPTIPVGRGLLLGRGLGPGT